jgi:hypothetical protein
MVPLLPWHALVDGAARAEGLALRDLASAAAETVRWEGNGRSATACRSRDGGQGTTDRPTASDP